MAAKSIVDSTTLIKKFQAKLSRPSKITEPDLD